MKIVAMSRVIFGLVISMASLAGTVDDARDKAIRSGLLEALPKLTILSIRESKVDGLYEVDSDSGAPLFSNKDGSLFISGELYSTKGGRLANLTEKGREKFRADQLAAIKDSDKIIFAPSGPVKANVSVFTDLDCGYCRKLHKEVPRMNELGIRISYLAFPRAGIGSSSYKKIVSAWCSDDPKKAMTDAKLGKTIPAKTCENPVASQYRLGQKLGVTGTPSVILDNGQIVGGYLSADALAKGLGLL